MFHRPPAAAQGIFYLLPAPWHTGPGEALWSGQAGEARTGAAGAAVPHLRERRQCAGNKKYPAAKPGVSQAGETWEQGIRVALVRPAGCKGTSACRPQTGLLKISQYLLRACLLFFMPVPYPFFHFFAFSPLHLHIISPTPECWFPYAITCLGPPLADSHFCFFEQLTDRISVFARGVSCLHDRHEVFLDHPPVSSFLYTKRPLCRCCRHSGLLRDTAEKVACAESGGNAASGEAPEREALTRCAERGGEAVPRLRKLSFVPGAFL